MRASSRGLSSSLAMILLLGSACTEKKGHKDLGIEHQDQSPIATITSKYDGELEHKDSEHEPERPTLIEDEEPPAIGGSARTSPRPIDPLDVPIGPIYPGAFIPIPIPGGGGQPPISVGLCQESTTDCNDKNPCTIDSCSEADECINEFDESKQELGSCEVDGSSCTIGKCASIEDSIQCFEQNRKYVLGELGCADEDQCTADSCIEIPLDIQAKRDQEGNTIPDNDYRCAREIINGLSCFIEHDCLLGICEVSGTGMPEDEFQLSCIPNEEASVQPYCPNSDNNPCTLARCDLESGCVVEDLPDDTPCDDHNPCTLDETCQSGQCISASMLDCDDNNICTEDFCTIKGCEYVALTGPYGDSCTSNHPGICTMGQEMCIAGELSDPLICTALILPGDKNEICADEQDLDEDCDGQIDNPGCDCPPPPDGAIARYVDPNGSDNANDCTDQNTPCQTIAYAISQAISGDALVLSDGVFPEYGLVVDKDLFILGEGSTLSIVDAQMMDRVISITSESDVTICGLDLTNGQATSDGGGIFLEALSSLTLINSRVENNQINITRGGGIYSTGSLHIINSAIVNNTSNFGAGGIEVRDGDITIANSTIAYNIATAGDNDGGAIKIVSGTMLITNSTINNNSADMSPGIYSMLSNVDIINSTISSNSNLYLGIRQGLAISTSNSTMTILNSTIAHNTGPHVGIEAAIANGNNSTMQIGHTIISHVADGESDCDGTIIDLGYNLESGTSCNFSNNAQQNADADLGPLADNGGGTFTHALGSSSDAIDNGDIDCGVSIDQRGEMRPADIPGYGPDTFPRCDIGSFELQP